MKQLGLGLQPSPRHHPQPLGGAGEQRGRPPAPTGAACAVNTSASRGCSFLPHPPGGPRSGPAAPGTLRSPQAPLPLVPARPPFSPRGPSLQPLSPPGPCYPVTPTPTPGLLQAQRNPLPSFHPSAQPAPTGSSRTSVMRHKLGIYLWSTHHVPASADCGGAPYPAPTSLPRETPLLDPPPPAAPGGAECPAPALGWKRRQPPPSRRGGR